MHGRDLQCKLPSILYKSSIFGSLGLGHAFCHWALFAQNNNKQQQEQKNKQIPGFLSCRAILFTYYKLRSSFLLMPLVSALFSASCNGAACSADPPCMRHIPVNHEIGCRMLARYTGRRSETKFSGEGKLQLCLQEDIYIAEPGTWKALPMCRMLDTEGP